MGRPGAAATAVARFAAGDLQGAIATAGASRALSGEGPEQLAARALTAASGGDWQAAREAADAALAALAALPPRPGAADAADPAWLALWCRATARCGLGDRRGAEADLSALLEAAPRLEPVWKDRAILRALVGDRAGARADLARAALLEPDDAVPHLLDEALGLVDRPCSPEGLVPAGRRLEAFAAGEPTAWVALLARFVLGRETLTTLLRAAELDDPTQRTRRLCQAHGYAGMLCERAGDHAAARLRYESCRATGVFSFLVHIWARERLRDA